MKQVATAGLRKALAVSVVTFFAAGLLSDGASVYAQNRKSTQPPPVEAETSEAMELPGIFKITPATAVEITQKGSRPAATKRNSQPQFSADADKVTGKARRAAVVAPVVAALPKRADEKKDAKREAKPEVKKDVKGDAQAGARKDPSADAKEDADKREAKKILIPARLANSAEKFSGSDFHATAYCLKGRTASGEMVRTGLVAADPKVLPLGTLVRIDAGKYSGIYKVADTGGAIKGNKIDIYVPTYREAKLFGRQKIKVTVLDKGGKGKKSR